MLLPCSKKLLVDLIQNFVYTLYKEQLLNAYALFNVERINNMLLQFFRTLTSGAQLDSDYLLTLMVSLVALAIVLLCCLPVHEFAHAWMATKLGDQTPRLSGRLTLNPFVHLDLWGTVMILLVGIGYAKPVQVNPRNMRVGSKKGLALTALAGPVSNIILSFILLLISKILLYSFGNSDALLIFIIIAVFEVAATVNVTLAAFNLLPLPPLDGFNILQMFLPQEALEFVSRYHTYIRYALLAMVFFGWFTGPITWLGNLFFSGINWLANLPFVLLG